MDAIVTRRLPETSGLSPEGIMRLGLGFWASKTLLSAVELELFTVLAAEGPLDAEALRRRLAIHPRGARDFFDALVALGMLERQGGRYRNTPETDVYLDRAKPSYVGGMLRWADTRVYTIWGNLTAALRAGGPQAFLGEGEDLFDALGADPAALAGFAQAMTGSSLPVARALATRFPWARHASFIDVGTSEGGAAVEIARAHPHLEGGGFDLPRVRPLFDAYVARHGLAERLRFHAGDFLEGPLPAAEVLVMGQVLHDWDLAVKRELLAKAHAALPKGGVLIVYDQMIDDARRENVAGLLMSLNMLLRTRGGFDYTGADCIGWMREAGFSALEQRHLSGPFSMVAGTK